MGERGRETFPNVYKEALGFRPSPRERAAERGREKARDAPLV
jgi:hypothetical protein